ncbi:MAG TPA: hypothetical protein VEV83_16155 [Parafilimonas sp.]|nr:hypothetical protein [Parafilimonas sp.]
MEFKHCEKSCLLLLVLLTASTSFAQKLGNPRGDPELRGLYDTWEFSVTVGANNFEGDLGGTPGIGGTFKDYTFHTLRPAFGASACYNVNPNYGIRAGFNYTWVCGFDSLIPNTGDQERWRIYRNGNFRSNIWEAYVSADIYPLMLFQKTYEIDRLAPVLGVGLGVFHFKPEKLWGGQWNEVQHLHLEGQEFAEYPDRHEYKLTQLYIPITIALKYYLDYTNKWALTGGLAMRHTFTDYIDDISTTYIDPNLFDKYLPPDQAALAKQLYSTSIRPEKVKPNILKADPNDKDTYLTFFLTLSIRLFHVSPFMYGR